MNAPDREECYVLDASEVKMVAQEDAKITNAVNFTIAKEDHTVGNLLVSQLLKYSDVRFAGYRIPHPLEYILMIKLQTDGKKRDPIEAITQATKDRISELDQLKAEFEKAKNVFQGRTDVDAPEYDEMM
mmetsp:Transcript_1681/g.2032  ORF Transcript_1681/g.2032 Transcript_1681/m.2032 type:complete len:129 (+) Transcript_1681:162-548(+)